MTDTIVEVFDEESFVHIIPLQSLDDTAVNAFSNVVEEWCENSSKDIVLDFKNVNYLYSRGVTCIVRFHILQHEKGKKIVLVNVSEDVRKLLDTVNITAIIPVFKTYEEFQLQ